MRIILIFYLTFVYAAGFQQNVSADDCSSVAHSSGDLVTILDQTACGCDNENNYYNDLSGMTCLNHIYTKTVYPESGLGCKDDHKEKERFFSKKNTTVESAMECLQICGTASFEVDLRNVHPDPEMVKCVCYSECEQMVTTPARDTFQVGMCNFDNSVEIFSGTLSNECVFCDTTKGLILTNGVCSCEEGKGISDGVCSDCGENEKQSVDGLECVCKNNKRYFGEAGNCNICNDETVNQIVGNELCIKIDWQYIIVSSQFIQGLQTSLATLGGNDCPLA